MASVARTGCQSEPIRTVHNTKAKRDQTVLDRSVTCDMPISYPRSRCVFRSIGITELILVMNIM
jgi:hypothetical protein